MTHYRIDPVKSKPGEGMSVNAIGFVENLRDGVYDNPADLLSLTCNIPWEAARALVKGEVEYTTDGDSVVFEYHHRAMSKQDQKKHNKAQKRCDDWNDKYPEGTWVHFKDISNDFYTTTKSIAWVCGICPVVKIDGKSGGVGLDFLKVLEPQEVSRV